jgi:Mg2+-importing ATPase
MSNAELFESLKTSDVQGLSQAEVLRRQQTYGLNALHESHKAWWKILWEQFSSPFIYLLIIISIVTFFLQDAASASIMFACVVINTLVGFYQEYKAEQSLELLKRYLINTVSVVRDSKQEEVASKELVPGDIIHLYPGDIIPADVRFIQQENLQVDESLLTGESLQVRKIITPLQTPANRVYEATNIGFAGTTITSGKALGVVVATGSYSSLGVIAQLTNTNQRVSGFYQQISSFSRFIVCLIVVTIIIIFLAHFLLSQSTDIMTMLIFSIALGVTVIPEALPVVTTFGFTRGALHLAQQKVVVKRLSSIEDLGSIEVLCTDKTGTLTENKLKISGIYGPERPVLFWSVLGAGISSRNLSAVKGFDSLLYTCLLESERKQIEAYQLIKELPFDPVIRRSAVLWRMDEDGYELVIRGSFDDVAALTVSAPEEQKKIADWVAQQGNQGYRIIAIAKKRYESVDPASFDIATEQSNATLIGLIAFEDPLKISAQQAIQKAKQLGIQIKIISGDNQQVCAAIAEKVGLIHDRSQVIMGDYFEKQTTAEKKKLVDDYSTFARITPAQKFEIIQLLQTKYQVGYMGDGINDAPALKIANVALAVSDAADIAREAADIILLHKSLQVIVNGIELGREIFANTLKYIKITLAAGFGHFYALAMASLIIDFLPMLPTQLLLLNLLTDIPLIALSTDTVALAEVKEPSKYDIKHIIIVATTLGLVVSTFDFILFSLFYRSEPAVLQTTWFMSCVLTELLFTFSARSSLPFYKAKRPSFALVALSALIALLAIALPFTSVGQQFLHFKQPQGIHLIIITSIAVGCFITTECVKLLYYRYFGLYRNNACKL